MVDRYKLAMKHLQAAMTAMIEQQDTLATATIAQALSVVERMVADDPEMLDGTMPVANRLPC